MRFIYYIGVHVVPGGQSFGALYFLSFISRRRGFLGFSVALFGWSLVGRMADGLGRRSERVRAAPSRLVNDDTDDPHLDPPVGRMYA